MDGFHCDGKSEDFEISKLGQENFYPNDIGKLQDEMQVWIGTVQKDLCPFK